MLSFFRKGGLFTQVFMGAVVLAIIAAFLFTGRFGSSSKGDRCAVKLDDACVDLKEFTAGYGLAIRASRLELPPEGVREIKAMVLNGFAERLLLVEDAKRFGISVSEEELDAELREGRTRLSLPAEHEAALSAQLGLCEPEGPGCAPGTMGIRLLPVKDKGTFNPDLYRRLVRNFTGRGPKQFKEMQHLETIAARMRNLIRSRARVSEREAFLLWERERSQAVIRSVRARADWMARYVLSLGPADIDVWALENKDTIDTRLARAKDDFKDGCPLVSEIFIKLPPDASEEEKQQKRTEIEEAQRRLKAGSSFALVARELSDSSSASLGGELGCLTEDYGPGAQELLQAVGKLKPGKVSPIVETVRGYHLLEFEGPLAAGQAETVARAHVAKELAVHAKAKELAQQFAKDLIAAAKTSPSLKQATDDLVASYLERGPFAGRQDGSPGAGDDARPKVEISSPFNVLHNPISNALQGDVAALAFQLKEPDELYSKPIETADGAAVMQLKSKEPAKRAEFDKDKAKLMRQLQQAKANDTLQAYVKDLREQAGDRLSFDKELVDSTKEKGDDESPNDES